MINALSLRARLTIWYTVVLVVALVLFGVNVLLVEQRLGLRRMDEQLDQLHATLMKVLRGELEEGGTLEDAAKEALDTVGAPGIAAAVLDDRQHPLAPPVGDTSATDLSLHPGPDAVATTVQATAVLWRVHARVERVSAKTGDAAILVAVARPMTDISREESGLREAMLLGFPVALLLAGAGGLWLATVGLSPITRMAEQAARIQPNGLEDLGETGRRDELGKLARAFNGLVARLRAALQTERQFMADASHELRTPISVVRTAADVALARDHRDEADYRETLSIVRDQSRQLSRLVEDMLTLARADAGGFHLRPVSLYLDDVVADCRRAVAVLAADRGISIRTAPTDVEIPYEGDEQLLRQLVVNLMQNAVQHTPRGGTMSVETTVDADGIDIRVANTGCAIPPADQDRIFDRFVQLDPAREGSGTGLGLPIAKWIAEAHGGRLILESSGPDGSVFLVSLPRSRSN